MHDISHIRLSILAAVICLLALPAAADDGWPRDDAAYRELIRQAAREYEINRWAEAKLYFEKAHALYPNARTLRGLGLVAFALRDYVTAIGQLEAALADEVQPLTPLLRDQIAKQLARARQFVGRMKVVLEPSDAELIVDDWLPVRTRDGSVWLNPGSHDLIVSRKGYETETRRISVQADTEIEVSIALRALREHAPQLPAAAPAPRETAPPLPRGAAASAQPRSIAPWIVVGVAGALAVAGGVLLGVALHDVDRLEHPKLDTPWSAASTEYRGTQPLSAAGIALLGAGAAGLGAGLLWAFSPPDDSRELSLDWSPMGATLRGAL